jgi:tripartite-type tricarboxylate transporter receptor subunit TctC
VQSQPPDGHTVLIGAIGQLAVATAIYPGKLSFHPTRTLMPVTMLGSYPLVLSGPASGEIKTVAELVAFGKANPDKSNYPTSSPAFTIASELFKLKTGMPGQPIPYRSTNEMVLSVVGGQTLFAFPDSGIVVPMAQGGKVRALAVGSSSRIPELPDTPTLAEAGRATSTQDAVDRRVSHRRLAGADREETRDGVAPGGRRRRRARAHPRHHVFSGGAAALRSSARGSTATSRFSPTW